jgi:hypothetical protein
MIGRMKSQVTAAHAASYVLLAVCSLLLIVIAVYSLEWRTSYDPIWMLYDGWLIDQHHLVPYRDFHEINFPGSLYLYTLIGRVISFTNERLLRVIDLAYLGAIGLVTWIWLRPLGSRVAGGAAVLFGVAYLSSDITVNIQRDYFIILPLVGAAAIAVRLSHWPLAARGFLVGVLGGLVATIKPHALIGWPIILGFMYFDTQRIQPQRSTTQILRIGLSSLVGLLVPIGLMILYLVRSGSLSDFIEIETQYVPLYSHVMRAATMIDYSERSQYMLGSYFGFNGFGWWFIPAGIGVVSSLYGNKLEKKQRWQIFQIMGLALCYSLYPVVSGQFFNYHWLPFVYFLMTLSALSLNSLPNIYPVALHWLPKLALVGALMLPPSQIPGMLDRLNRYYVQGQPIPPIDGGVADEMAAYLRMHHQPGDRVQVLGSGGAPLHGLLMAGVAPATYFSLDISLYHDLSHPIIQKYRQIFLSQMGQAPPRFVVDMHHRHFLIGPDSNIEFPEFSQWLTRNYQLAYVGRAFSIYERQSNLRHGFVVYPLRQTDIPIRYHLEATSDVLSLDRQQVLDSRGMNDALSGFVNHYDVVSAEYLAEQDPERAIETWLGQHAFRIGEHWITSTRIVEYLIASPECLRMQSADITFGSSIRLEQYAAALTERGGARWVCVRLEWSATELLSDSYKLSVRVETLDGKVIVAYDSQPAGYLAPTTTWKPGERIDDQLALPLPTTLTPGRYRVGLVVYNEASGERLAIESPEGVWESLLLDEIVIID